MANELTIYIPTGTGAINQTVYIHNVDSTIPVYIDWGDGTPIIAYTGEYISHVYTSAGSFNIYAYFEDVWGDDLGDGITMSLSSGDTPFLLIDSGDVTILDGFTIGDYTTYSQGVLNNGFLNLSLPYTTVALGSNEFAVADNINDAFTKLDTNTTYLLENTDVIDSTVQNLFTGWLSGGASVTNLWNVDIPGFDTFFDVLSAPSGFSSLADIKVKDFSPNRYIYLIDNNRVKVLNGYSAYGTLLAQASSIGFNEPFISLSALDVNSTGEIYLLDGNILFKTQYNAVAHRIELQARIGGTGDIEDRYLFNHATDIAVDSSDRVIVADTNNLCLKVYNKNLIWLDTIETNIFTSSNKPIKVCTNAVSNEIYVLTTGLDLVTFNSSLTLVSRSSLLVASNIVTLAEILSTQSIQKMFSDNQNNYLYIVTDSATVKLTRRGRLINKIENPEAVFYTNIRSGCVDPSSQIMIAKSDRVYRLADPIVSVSLKRDTETPISLSAITMNENGHEFVQDWVYNKALKKLLRNLVILNGSLNQKIVVSFDLDGSLRSFYIRPLEEDEKVDVHVTLDNYVNVNEFVLSDVVNRALNKILDNQVELLAAITPSVVFIPASTTYPVLP